MNYKECVERLPSLAHPLVNSAREGVENDKAGVHFLPPFPDIDLVWDSFTFSHLHWVGIKVTAQRVTEKNLWRLKLAICHELYHKHLNNTPFLRVKRAEMLRFYIMIREKLETFKEGQEPIQVPVLPDDSGDELQKQWAVIVNLHRATVLVEEVFAVRWSLLFAREEGLITHGRRRSLITRYKGEYGKTIPGFPQAYDAFDLIARKIGEDAAEGLIYSVLRTGNPTIAFFAIIEEMCKIKLPVPTNGVMWNLSDEETNFLAHLSYEQAYHFFNKSMDDSDPDDSRYLRRKMLEIIAAIDEEVNVAAQEKINDFLEFVLGLPMTFLVSHYDEFIHKFSNEGSKEVSYGSRAIVLEAIRQQLTKGIGLVCPFWTHAPHTCCSSFNRALLEKVWSCTSPIPGWKLWMRGGCLDKEAVARFKRRPKNIGS
jgi:hypothetical protein